VPAAPEGRHVTEANEEKTEDSRAAVPATPSVITTLRHALQFRYDLTSPPRKTLLKLLADHCGGQRCGRHTLTRG
jgi:hypothetical protein